MKQLIPAQAQKKEKKISIVEQKNMVELIIEPLKIPTQANSAVLLPDILLPTNIISLSAIDDPHLTG